MYMCTTQIQKWKRLNVEAKHIFDKKSGKYDWFTFFKTSFTLHQFLARASVEYEDECEVTRVKKEMG